MFRSATTRLILVHLALLAVLTAVVLGSLYWRVGGVIDAEQRAVVEAEVRGFTDDYARGGIPALAVAIERRLASPTDRDAVYLLATAAGERIAGNLGRWPPTVAPDAGWTTLSLYRTDRDRPTDISALALRLPGGELLLVGRDVAARALFDRTLFRAVVWALAAIVLLTAATGWFLSRLIRGHVTEIDGAARGIMAGALDRRIPTRGSGDEFDALAATLNAMLDRIEALVSDLRMVTDSLAHDLRQPLGRLVRELEAANDETAGPEVRRARIERAQREAEGVLATATALFDIARIEAGIGADQFAPVDLGRVAAGVAELYEAAAEEQGVRLVASAEPGLVVRGHDQLLALALSNLVDNALRHAPEGSAVDVAARHEAGAPALVVGDRGPGIPAADRERALGRLVRLDPSRGGPGAGLGLALVAAVARMHDATLALSDNAPGLVATLRFTAPAAPSESVAATAPSIAETRS
jgi:signal transduction histidine kinase